VPASRASSGPAAPVRPGSGLPGQRGADFGAGAQDVQPIRGRRGAVGVSQVEDQLRPEEAAHGGIGARFGGRGVERGEERQDGDEVTAPVSHPVTHRLEIGQVPHGARAGRAQRREVCTDAEAPAGPVPAPGGAGRGDHGGGPAAGRGLDVEVVIAQGKRSVEGRRSAALEAELDRGPGRERERREGAVPRDDHGRDRLFARRGPHCRQGFPCVGRTPDRSAEGGADADQRLGSHRDRAGQAVHVGRPHAQFGGERRQRAQVVHRVRAPGGCGSPVRRPGRAGR